MSNNKHKHWRLIQIKGEIIKKIEYKGYTISQADNNYIMIIKDNQSVFHASCTKLLNKEELKKHVDWFIKFKDMLDEKR